MKHPYTPPPAPPCTAGPIDEQTGRPTECRRCARERERRQTQSAAALAARDANAVRLAADRAARKARRHDRATDRWIENLDHDHSMNG